MGELPLNTVVCADCFDVLDSYPANVVDATVTDPPYNFDGGFMAKGWDDIGGPEDYQRWCRNWAESCYRLTKPGGWLVAFSSVQMFHRLCRGVEAAGFQLHAVVPWVDGEGMPKSQNIDRDIDKELGQADKREVVQRKVETSGWKAQDKKNARDGYRPQRYTDDEPDVIEVTKPASDLAQRFEGFGTKLKPAHDPVILARVPTPPSLSDIPSAGLSPSPTVDSDWCGPGARPDADEAADTDATPNEILDTAVDVYDEARSTEPHPDGEPFVYASKASTAEKTLNGKIDNPHPTVKPLDVMETYISMTTEVGDTVIDPFAGSGTTLRAAKDIGRRFVGIEVDAETADIARARVGLEPQTGDHVLSDDSQTQIGEFD